MTSRAGVRPARTSSKASLTVCPQRQGAGSSDVRAPEFQFDEARRSYAIGMAVLDGGVPASAGRTAVVPGGARLLPTMSRAGRVPIRATAPGHAWAPPGRPPGIAVQMDDLADAILIAQMLAATARWEATTGRRMLQKPLREAIWFVWQHPRLPRPLVRGKCPMSVRWTAAARAAYAEDPACPLVIEHVEPMRDLIRRLMPLAGDPATVAQKLRAADQYCVLTPKEDKNLPSGSIGNADPWTRYALAGIDRSGPGAATTVGPHPPRAGCLP
jgi:hypothetical protein